MRKDKWRRTLGRLDSNFQRHLSSIIGFFDTNQRVDRLKRQQGNRNRLVHHWCVSLARLYLGSAKNQKTTSEAGFKKSKSESDRRHRIKSLGRFGGLNQEYHTGYQRSKLSSRRQLLKVTKIRKRALGGKN